MRSAQASYGTLYVLGTPIGNLGDISQRAIQTLEHVACALCEDTRVSAKLCAALDIKLRLERCDENVLAERIPTVLERLGSGENIAFMSDAGMPCISDPGQRLVDAVLDAGLSVEVIPGPSALDSAVAASGLRSEHLFFEGFLPKKEGAKRSRLQKLLAIPATLVIYESPKRLLSTLEALNELVPERRIAVARELTKLHEELLRGTAHELLSELSERASIRGECVVVIEEGSTQLTDASQLDERIREGLDAGEKNTDLAKRLSREFGMRKADVYGRILELDEGGVLGSFFVKHGEEGWDDASPE